MEFIAPPSHIKVTTVMPDNPLPYNQWVTEFKFGQSHPKEHHVDRHVFDMKIFKFNQLKKLLSK